MANVHGRAGREPKMLLFELVLDNEFIKLYELFHSTEGRMANVHVRAGREPKMLLFNMVLEKEFL